jgi:hypothetical protein
MKISFANIGTVVDAAGIYITIIPPNLSVGGMYNGVLVPANAV